jgi:hypothetical protein
VDKAGSTELDHLHPEEALHRVDELVAHLHLEGGVADEGLGLVALQS